MRSLPITLALLLSAGAARADLRPRRHVELDDPARAQATRLAGEASRALVRGADTCALDLANQSIAVDARYPWGHYARGVALVSLGRIDEATAAFRQAEGLFGGADPWGQSLSALGRARALELAGRCEEAEIAYGELAGTVRRDDPRRADAAMRHGRECRLTRPGLLTQEKAEETAAPGAERLERPEASLRAAAYGDAVAAYSLELGRLHARGASPGGLGQAIDRLADALEKVPAAGRVDVVAAAQRVRAQDARGVLASAPAAGARTSLAAASGAILALAEGPYRGNEAVQGRARDFAAAVRAIPDAARAPADDAILALERAEAVLQAIAEAPAPR